MTDLSVQRRGVLNEITQRLPGFSCQGVLGAFLDHYFVAEVLARKIMSFYQEDTNKSCLDKIQVQQLSAAIKYFKVSFPELDTRVLFLGGEGLRGNKSARQLRNGYVHSLSAEDRVEIERMAPQFNEMLNRFIKSISSMA